MFNPSVTNCNSKHDLAGEVIFYVIYPQFWEIINFFWMILGNFEKIEIGFFLKITNERGITSKERGKIWRRSRDIQQTLFIVCKNLDFTHMHAVRWILNFAWNLWPFISYYFILPSRWCVNIIHIFMFCIVVIAIGSELYIPYVNLFSFVCATVPIMRNSISDIISTNIQDKTRALDYLLNLVSKYAF